MGPKSLHELKHVRKASSLRTPARPLTRPARPSSAKKSLPSTLTLALSKEFIKKKVSLPGALVLALGKNLLKKKFVAEYPGFGTRQRIYYKK